MRFFDFVHENFIVKNPQQHTFELQAGLVSALYEFSRALGLPIELLRYKSSVETEESPIIPYEIQPESDVLITAQTESFLIPSHFAAKIYLIYNEIISHHIPLGPHKRISDADEQFIVDLLEDRMAVMNLEKHEHELTLLVESFFKDYGDYGLEGLFISSFDARPLWTYNISMNEAYRLLRKLGNVPKVPEMQWKYRMILQKGLYIINSGISIRVKNLKMPYYYFLITNETAYLGDSPTTIYQKLNSVLLPE